MLHRAAARQVENQWWQNLEEKGCSTLRVFLRCTCSGSNVSVRKVHEKESFPQAMTCISNLVQLCRAALAKDGCAPLPVHEGFLHLRILTLPLVSLICQATRHNIKLKQRRK